VNTQCADQQVNDLLSQLYIFLPNIIFGNLVEV